VAIEVAETDEFKHGFAEAIATQYGIDAEHVEVGAVTPLRRKLSSSGVHIKFTMDVEDPAAIEAVEVDAGALVAATLDAFTGDAGLLAALSISDLAPPVQYDPADPDPDAEYYYNSLVEGNGFDIVSPGTGYGYNVGQQFAVGEAGVDGWTTPAVFSVAAVDDSGGLLSADLIDGGRFSGGKSNKIDNYPAIVQVLVRATASKSKVANAPHQIMPTTLVLGLSSVCFLGGALAALMVVRRYTTSSATAEAPPALDSAMALTPDCL
jgi:hypothetical protein